MGDFLSRSEQNGNTFYIIGHKTDRGIEVYSHDGSALYFSKEYAIQMSEHIMREHGISDELNVIPFNP